MWHALKVTFATVMTGLLAFSMLVAEFRVVCLSSGLSLSVAGIFKELLTVLSSAALLGDQLTPFNICGLLLCTSGIIMYHRYV